MWLMMDILDCEGVEVKPETAKPKKKKKRSHEYDTICLDVVTLWFFFFFGYAVWHVGS